MKERKIQLKELQEKLNVYFDDVGLLEVALTHSSYANEKRNVKFNERLEFLGDSVLQLIITEYLFCKYKSKEEGELTKKRAIIVCENSLYEIAKKWNLGSYINMSKGEELTGGRSRVSILADCVEAILAAVYLDKGFETTKEFIYNNFIETIEKAIKNQIILDYKTKLQENIQQRGETEIKYNLVKYEGPPHRRKFFIELVVNNQLVGNGMGFSKKEAEQNAAKMALKRMDT